MIIEKVNPAKNPGYIENLLKEKSGEIIDCIEGVLLDSILIDSAAGYIAIMDTFVNSNMSIYTVYTAENETDNAAIFEMWGKYEQ